MKKTISLILCAVLLCFTLSAGAFAVSVTAGDSALRAQFASGSGGGLSYMYFAPDVSDGTKVPLVVWLHGIASGNYNGDQIDSYDICKWTSDEYQARFKNGNAAFVLAPKASGTWDITTVSSLKSCIDSFVSRYENAIDKNRIYVIGFSIGATMTISLCSAYPDYFAAALPISAVTQTPANIKALSGMAVWFFANEKDTYVSANRSATQSSFNTLVNASENKSNKRFTWVSKAVTPTGDNVSAQHYMWRTLTNDMFMADNTQYAYATTVDGNGNTVSFTYPDGIISWLSTQTRAQTPSGDSTSVWEKIVAFFNMIFGFLLKLLSA